MEKMAEVSHQKDMQLQELAKDRRALEANARVQATELDMMAMKMQEMQEELNRGAQQRARIESEHTTGVSRSAAAVELALETNDEETREKMEEMEAELTKMLCALHMKQAMMGFHE